MEYYPLMQIVRELIKTHNLARYKNMEDTLRKKIEAVCEDISVGKDLNLWQVTDRRDEGKNKPKRLFTEREKYMLLNNDELQTFLRNNSSKKELFEQAEKWNQPPDIDYGEDAEGYSYYGVSDTELRQMELDIMIEALFLRHFMPIDREQLLKDWELKRLTDGSMGSHTPESVEAVQRFQKRTCYYTEKKR